MVRHSRSSTQRSHAERTGYANRSYGDQLTELLPHLWNADSLPPNTVVQLRILIWLPLQAKCLAIRARRSFPARAVLTVLKQLFAEHGAPEFLRSDNGPEFIAKAVRHWLSERGALTLYIDPGSPWQNPFGESLNGRCRDECLNREVFVSVAEAAVIAER